MADSPEHRLELPPEVPTSPSDKDVFDFTREVFRLNGGLEGAPQQPNPSFFAYGQGTPSDNLERNFRNTQYLMADGQRPMLVFDAYALRVSKPEFENRQQRERSFSNGHSSLATAGIERYTVSRLAETPVLQAGTVILQASYSHKSGRTSAVFRGDRADISGEIETAALDELGFSGYLTTDKKAAVNTRVLEIFLEVL